MSEKNYPKTRMSDDDLVDYITWGTIPDDMRRMADAAIARSIEDGDVVPVEMLKTLALAVMGVTMNASSHRDVADYSFIDTAAIIERVKGGA